MIEILLQAERALSMGMLDQAERMYRQAAGADARNSIAVVGLARVALERGDEPASWRFAHQALEIDPENVAAQRLADRLEEVWAYRGQSLPEVAMAEAADAPDPEAEPAVHAAAEPTALEAPDPPAHPASEPEAAPAEDAASTTPARQGVVDRLLRRNRA